MINNNIYIDFQGGAHGNYLEFICNKFLAKIDTLNEAPFNNFGAAHDKQYLDERKFYCDHYCEHPGILETISANAVISIQITENDLLPLALTSLLRAGDYNINPKDLEHDTFNKFNNINYRSMLDNLKSGFFENNIKDGYNAVKDESWPEVFTHDDFLNLPEHIREECLEYHNLEILQFDEKNSNCPRHILREFFRIGFSNPSEFGFMERQENMGYPSEFKVFVFPYIEFYDTKKFLKQIYAIAKWADYAVNYEDINKIKKLHKEFLLRQPYINAKNNCDALINLYIKNALKKFPEMSVIEEAYIESKVNKIIF